MRTGLALQNIASFNAIDIFLLPSSFVALSGAAAAGPKRLSSDTYKRLNLSVVGLFVTRLASRALPEGVVFDPLVLLEIAAIGASFVGLFRGQQNESKLLKSFSS